VRVVFGACEFDSLRHLLRHHGRETPLSPRAFQLLEILIDRRPEVVSKNELLEQLWPGVFVSDAGLHNLVAELRAAIGDTPQASRFIRTVPRCGYAFHGDAQPASAIEVPTSLRAGRARLVTKRHDWWLSRGVNLVGRDPECRVSIDAPSVSRRHARIVLTDDAATVEDLDSKNGTFVNGHRITGVTALEDGCQIRIGSVRCVYRRRPFPSTMTQR
jgi:DNA-binding winged helix-turn-helix (wHTH) protein